MSEVVLHPFPSADVNVGSRSLPPPVVAPQKAVPLPEEDEDDSDPIEWDDMNMPQFLFFGSLISVSCDLHLYPFELVKTRLQIQVTANKSFPNYRGLIDAFRTIPKQEGIRGLYKGFGVTMVGYVPSELIYYSVYEYGKQFWKNSYRQWQARNESLPSLETVEPFIYLVCGGVAELCSASVWIPCDILQQKLMVQGPLRQRTYNGGVDAIKKIWADDGIRGFYRGALATCLLFSCQSSIHWMVYERSRRFFHRRVTQHNQAQGQTGLTATQRTLMHMGCGGLSGAVAAFAATPFDVIKTRLQVQQYHSRTNELAPSERNVRTMFRHIVRENGWRGLWRGASARMLYHAPVTSVTVMTYEIVKRFALKSNEE